MSAEPSTTRISQIPDEEVHKALLLLYSLSKEAQESINELMHKLQIRFAEAALHTGAITQDELDRAMDWIRHRAVQQGRGIIEEVLRRQVRRDVVLWQGNQLRPSELLVLAHDSNHPRSETLRTLRTELLMRTKNMGGSGILALVSPCASEGRSQLSAELAIAFAQLGRRTLLIDADLRRPRQHVLFGAQNDNGLAQALDGRAVHLRGVEGLPQMALLTSGTLPPNPLELLAGHRFERLLAEWRRTFEFVILDTPPATESSDAITVASAVGQVLMLSRSNATPLKSLKEMSRKLEAAHARTLGAVIGRF
jgi:protein-tyrosine kinase